MSSGSDGLALFVISGSQDLFQLLVRGAQPNHGSDLNHIYLWFIAHIPRVFIRRIQL